MPTALLTVSLADGSVQERAWDPAEIVGLIGHGWHQFQQYGREVLTVGVGRLADLPLGGTRRLFVCGWSTM